MHLNQIFAPTNWADIPELPNADAEAAAEQIVGPVQWKDGRGFCTCPGVASHSSRNPTECMIIAWPGAPTIDCKHGRCAEAVADANARLRAYMGKLRAQRHKAQQAGKPLPPPAKPDGPKKPHPLAPPKPEKPVFDPDFTARVAARLDYVDEDWLRLHSPRCVIDYTPATALAALFRPGEIVAVYHRYRARAPYLWTVSDDPQALRRFATHGGAGAWFLNTPLTGKSVEVRPIEGAPYQSFTKMECAATFRYLVLETDAAPPEHWLAVLAFAPLPIVMITHSGSKGAHALVRVDCKTSAEAQALGQEMARYYVPLGADPGALTPRRLTRLPGALREGSFGDDGELRRFAKPAVQRLLYLNPNADGTPIAEQEPHHF